MLKVSALLGFLWIGITAEVFAGDVGEIQDQNIPPSNRKNGRLSHQTFFKKSAEHLTREQKVTTLRPTPPNVILQWIEETKISSEFGSLKNPELKEIYLKKTQEICYRAYDPWILSNIKENPILSFTDRNSPILQNESLRNTLTGVRPIPIKTKIFNPTVEVLSIICCGLRDEDLKSLPSFQQVKKLDLSWNNISDEGIPYIMQLPNLTHLSLSATNIMTEGLKNILTLPGLQELDISRCEQLDEEAVALILEHKSLQKIIVHHSGISRKMQIKIRKKYESTFSIRSPLELVS